jgi:hypothetical protein
MSRYFAMSTHTSEDGARARAPTGIESSPPLDERAEVRDLLPDSLADAINATSANFPLQGDAYEHVERTSPLSEGGGVPPAQIVCNTGLKKWLCNPENNASQLRVAPPTEPD